MAKYNFRKALSDRSKSSEGDKEEKKNGYDFEDRIYRLDLEEQIGLDTFESDLSSLGDNISKTYNEWQTPETMANTKVAVESMQKRVDAFGKYKNRYMPDSTFDVDSLTSGYQKAIDDWDDLTKTYGYFKNAEAYNDFPNYLKSLEEANKKKEENKKKLDEAFLPYADYLEKDDYAEKSQYKNTATRGGFWKAIAFDGSDETYEYINDVDGARDKLIAKYKDGNDPVHLETHGYQFMTDNEKGVYNYIYATEGKKAAEKYLDALEISLNKRLYDKSTEEWEKMADDPLMAIAMTLATPITSMAGGIGSAIESAKEWATGGKYNPYASGRVAANATSDIRKYVGENIAESTEGMEVFGQNIPQFLYQTGMSIADSALGAYSLGKAFTPIMGMNAYQQTAKEMTEAGEDPETVQAMALASGVAETLFEYWSIEKLFKYKGVDSLKKGIKAALSQGVFEGFEEVSTELTNIIADDVFRGDGSDLQRQYNELIARGYSEEEAKEEVKKQFKTQLGWAFAGGALSGVAMGGAEAGNQYHNLTEMGANIRSNDRVSEMLDVASDKFMTANESDTYKLYTEYANKGVTADNISDVQLGNLYATSEMEAIDTLKSKKTTPQQKHDAGRRLEGLTRVSTAKTDEERAREARVKDLNTGEVTEVTSTGNSTKIEGIRMEDGKTILQTGEGEIAAEDMTFSQRDAELLAYAEGMGETKGSLLMAQYDGRANVESYVESFNLAYSYGETGFGSESVLRNKGVLSETQASAIYASAMTNKVREQQNAIDAINQKYSGNTEYHGTINDSAVNFENLTTSQRDAVNFVKAFAQVTGVNVEFFESDVVDGKRTGANGYYNKETNTIGIDVHAGINNINASDFKDAIIPTLSHEMTHWMKDKAPTLYNNMREIVMNTLTVDGLTSEARVAAEIQRMQKAHPDTKVTEDMAIDEIIARGCEDMLSNSQKAREMLSGLSENEQKSFIDKVKSTFQKLIDWANDLLSKYKSKSYEAQILRQYKDNLEELSKAWDQALTEAIQTNKALTAEGITGEQVIGENLFTETTAQLSMRTYENEGRELLHKWLENSDLDAETKTEIIEQMDHVYNVAAKYAEDNSLMDFGSWSETDIIRGADGSPLLSVVVPNGDYPLNIDFSQVCKKRKTLNAVLNALVRSGDLDFRSLSQSDINSINRIIKEHGFEIACALCFVDSKRYRVNDWADSFTDTYNKLVKSLVKGTNFVVDEFNYTGRPVKGVEGKLLKDADDSELNFDYINEVLAKNSSGKAIYRYALAIKNNKDLRSILRSSEIISSAGLDAIKVENRTLYDLVNSHQGSAKPKLAHGEVPYAYDILLQKKFNAEDAYKVGGVRMQSFSDYMANMFFDYVQMIGDLSAKQLPAHAYTKEYYFAKLFGLTGIKINLSVVPKGADITEDQKARFNKMTKAAKDKDPEFKKLKSHAGLDANGNYILEDETFPLDKALEIQNTEGYDKNCGIIWVGVSDKHIEKMLDDPNVPYIIPYHKSSLNPLIARMRNIDFYNDYTKAQNTRYDTKAKKKVPASIWSFDFYGDLAKTNDPRTTAENYKRECRERGYLPKFDDFASHPNYYKLLIDFRVYDNAGNYAPQGAVQMKFPDNFNEIVGESLREAQDTSARLDASMEGLLSDIRKELKIEKKQFSDRTATEEAKEFSDVNVQYSLREEAPPKTTAKAYKVFLLKNGQLYPPMVANPGGKGTPVGVWLNADAAPRAEDSKTGRPQVQAGGKGTNTGKMTLAYRPGWHLGDIPQATQFAKKNPETGIKELFPSNFVWAECEYATDVDYQEEAMSYGYNKNGKFQHSLAGLPKLPKDGYYRYRTNPNPDTVPWVITGAMKVNRILTDAETDAICRANGVEPLKRMGGPLTVEKLDAMGLAKLDYTQFSDRDSDGNTLTAEQMEYFKDSKVRDEDGRLIPMYHGTKAEFTEFKREFIGSTGAFEGVGFNFTPSKTRASSYSHGIVMSGYLNVTKPLSAEKKTFTVRNLANIIKEIDPTGDDIISNYAYETRDYGSPSFVSRESLRAARAIYDYAENDVDIYSELSSSSGGNENVIKAFEKLGYDGLIHYYDDGKIKTVITFSSNQFKNIDNTNPTEDADIRYSDRVFEEAEKVFGTTKVFEEVGYILPDGKMLKFTDKNNPGKRMYDHRAIAMAYGAKVDLNTNYGFSFENGKYLDDFVENGGIRFDSGNPDLATDVGLQLSSKIPLTKEQERVIRDLVEWKKHREETYLATTSEDDRWLYRPLAIRIAFGGDSNNGGGSDSIRRLNEKGVQYLSYEGGNINASRIINDIRKYYQTGEINEQSNVAMFHYSDRYEDAFFDLFDSDGTFAESSAIIEEDVNRLKQRLSIGASSMSAENIKMIAKHLLQKADSRYDFEELTDDIKDIFEYIRTSKDLDSNALIAKCKDVASRILADQNGEKVSRDYAKMILKEIRSEKISTSKEQLEGIKDRYGDKYNNAIIGRIPRSNNGVSLDSKWAEWSQKYPGIFDANIESKDMLTELDDIVKAMQSASDARHVFEEAVDTTSLGAEIYNQMWLRSTTDIKTDADKQRLKELNFAHRKAIDNVRNNLTNRQIDSMRMVQIIDNLKQKNKADVKKAKELGKERMDKYRDMVERKAKIEQISKTALTLNDWMRKPSNEKHIHDEMQPVVSYLLNAIDFSSKRLLNKGVETKKDISLQKALSDLQNATKDMRLSEDAIYALYGENLDEDVKKLVDSVNNTMRTVGDNHYILNQMSLEELETLYKVVKSIKHSVTQMNHFHVVNHSKGIINLGQEFINHAKKYGQIKLHKHGNDARFTLNWGNALPFFTMKRFGEAGVKVRNALMDGQDKLAFNADKIIKYAEKTYTSKECKEWSEDIKTIEILLPAKNGQPSEKKTIQIPVSHIMSLYCLSKREHALGHLSGGGIRIVDFETKNGVVSQSEGILLMGSELNKIVGKLTKRQIEVADALQKFMNEDCSDWGNEISMARFGYKAFTEKNYFPIASDKTVTGDGSVKDNEKSLYRLLNMSFAKPLTEKANNRIEVDNIFDVFAKHTSEMAKYNAMALPVLDAVRWFAYHEKGEKVDSHFKTESVRQAMEKAYGKDAVTYVRTLLEDINGADNVGRDKIAKGFMSKAKIASVGFNLKVVALQPTSYLRARAVIDGKYLIKAKTRKPKIDMAEKWCGIAKWKSFGFYDINIQRGLADLIKHDASLKDRITDASMKGAEWADKFTLGYLWNACEYEVMDKRKDLVVGSDEFNTEVGKKLREVIYSTQVVDSTMTRSHMMRSGDTKDKILTNFASEPTLSYNMVLDCVYDWSLTKRETGSNSEGFKKYGKKFARTLYAYTVTSAITAALETAFSMFRDDDEEKDEEEIIKMYLESFALNMSIMNKIPYAKELISIAQGFRSSNMETQWMQYFTYAAKEAMKVIEGEGNAYKMTKNALQGASYLSGIPAYNFIRDAKSLWNLVVGSAIPSLKLKVD